jgi:hypothetical protein
LQYSASTNFTAACFSTYGVFKSKEMKMAINVACVEKLQTHSKFNSEMKGENIFRKIWQTVLKLVLKGNNFRMDACR